VRVAIVTGGTRGIGHATARALLESGAAVAITGTSQDGMDRATAALAGRAQDGARVAGFACDVRDAAAVERMMGEVAARFGGVDVLVNNAGVGVFRNLADMTHDEWHRVLGVNLTGVFNCCKAVMPHLRQRGGGWIINISSLASKNPFAGGAAYSASKAALNALSEALMQEVRHENIRVSYVLPGSVATEFSGREAATGADWRLHAEDVAQVVMDLLAHPARSLPSRVELRPSRPQKA
jgi:3-oxoacyl-[acyl-carrier protein] reductase